MEGKGYLLFSPAPAHITPAFCSAAAGKFAANRRPVSSGLSVGTLLALSQTGRADTVKMLASVSPDPRLGWEWGSSKQGLGRRGFRQGWTLLVIASLLRLSSLGGEKGVACSIHSGTNGGDSKKEPVSEWEKLSDEERRAWRGLKYSQMMEGKLKLERAVNASSPLKWEGAVGLEIAFDMSYGASASEKMNNSLAMQLALAYSYAKTTSDTEAPAMHITSYSGAAKVALEKRGAAAWIAHKHRGSLREVFRERLGDLVYLSPDGEETLETLTPGKVYVIGGIVDRTVSKRVSWEEASGRRSGGAAIPTYRLPIDENIPRSFQGRGHVLNINTVFHILLAFRERGCWEEAIVRVMYAEAPDRFRDSVSPEQRARLDGARRAPQIPPERLQ
mmetsp:Transcript_44590/g.105658  ORF Transcript_44590/g.105658 Transcript_44590/m.105658 type:complete len:389 (+) Transcript_44590:220-1386(+)|eukprot:CAMPEP_0177698754 /NCGR_PEP_ID=MMETSP0484_2-20121128/5213_1 /TAXON_ID=354590 /ORGANISM="Rhodomonas lens, Strain RHODO" /LENGTH=388 /DNA_ID=CAMNT_0019209875 /DNA_START=195 /DNA_END=1361 /DNA_ORIENTATION=+